MRYLITGGCGFLGSNLASEVLSRSGELFVFDSLYREGSSQNLNWLKTRGDFKFLHADIRSQNDVEQAVRQSRPDVIFHLAGQVAMTTSLDNPRLDFETNVIGGHNVLEAVRKFAPETIVTYSSTNKVYGDLESVEYDETATRYVARNHPNGFDEQIPLGFQSPYGCSKGAADQYMLDYARMFGLKTIVFRHSSIFGGRQFSTYDQGWVGWFVQKALESSRGEQTPFTISGDGKQVRDVLFSDDLVSCYFSAIEHVDSAAGEAFNIGGGMANSFSLLELFEFLQQTLNVSLRYERLPWRVSDQKVFVADIGKATSRFGWSPALSKEEGVRKMISWVASNL
ncbi:MAG TPA: GDP-mannose 4,6-dehydratase [Thermoanaerobaculia bacterium]|jgi:CDP-paratose 2-epimerase